MEKLIVKGGNRLVGTVKTSGAKNAVLPIIAASILGETPSHLDEIPSWKTFARFVASWNIWASRWMPAKITP